MNPTWCPLSCLPGLLSLGLWNASICLSLNNNLSSVNIYLFLCIGLSGLLTHFGVVQKSVMFSPVKRLEFSEKPCIPSHNKRSHRRHGCQSWFGRCERAWNWIVQFIRQRHRITKIVSARETGKWTDFFLFEQWLLFRLPRQVSLCSAQLHRE